MSAAYQYATASNPCPACGGKTDCRFSLDSGAIHCRRCSTFAPPIGYDYRGDDKHGFRMFFPERFSPRDHVENVRSFEQPPPDLAAQRAAKEAAEKKSHDWYVKVSEAKPIKPRQRALFARQLGLPLSFIDTFRLRYHGKLCTLVYDMFDGASSHVGSGTRSIGGRQKLYAGNVGVMLPESIDEPNGVLFCVEGLSDALTLNGLDMRTIGRPSNLGGAEEFAQIVASRIEAKEGGSKQKIVIIGENDARMRINPQTDAEEFLWPGRQGAESVAQHVANQLRRTVFVVFPPDEEKDIRSWFHNLVKTHGLDPHSPESFVLNPSWMIADKMRGWLTDPSNFECFEPKEKTESSTSRRDFDADNISGLDDPSFLEKIKADREANETAQLTFTRSCPTPIQIFQSHPLRNKHRYLTVSCDRLNCPHCGPVKKRHYSASAHANIGKYLASEQASGRSPALFAFEISPEDWSRVTAYFRKVRARRRRNNDPAPVEHMAIHPFNDLGKIVCLSTVLPLGVEQLELDPKSLNLSAMALFNAAIERILPTIYDKRPFRGSSGWGLIEEKSIPQGWKNVTQANTDSATVEQIVAAYGANEPQISKGGPWYRRYQALTFSSMLIPDLKHFAQECEVGHRLFFADRVKSIHEHDPNFIPPPVKPISEFNMRI